MASTPLEQPRVSRRRRDDPARSSVGHDGIGNTSVPRSVGTRKRHRERLSREAPEVAEEPIEEAHSEGVWVDGPLALTLLPPLGAFLTGGDFIRDGLVLALLFYYLRALIKTPWELYLKARARRPPPSMEIEHEEDLEPEHIRSIRNLARSELQLAEITYLGLCLLTPFLGVLLMRWGASLIGADASLTWFSTGLFVLATGLRPWRHLIQLIITRTDSLHDIVHHPIVLPPRSAAVISDGRVGDLVAALDELRAAHAKQVAKHEQALAGVAEAQHAQGRAHSDALADAQAQLRSQVQALALAQKEHRQRQLEQDQERERQAKEQQRQQAQTQQPMGPTIAEIQSILARVEESIEHLEEQSRNTTRATELARLETSERFSSLDKSIDGLIKDVNEVQTRVATVAATASAASAVATEALDKSHQAQASAAAASVLAGEATTSIAAAARSANGAGRRSSTSLAWTAPPGAGLDPSHWNTGGPASPTLSTAREISPSGRPNISKRRTIAGGTAGPSDFINVGATNPNAIVYPVARPRELVDKIIHWSVHLLLVPVKISQGLLHRIIAALGVASDPTSPRISKHGDLQFQQRSAAGFTGSTLEGFLSPKGKGRAL